MITQVECDILQFLLFLTASSSIINYASSSVKT